MYYNMQARNATANTFSKYYSNQLILAENDMRWYQSFLQALLICLQLVYQWQKTR